MNYEEEEHAKQLYTRLLHELAALGSGLKVSVGGAGVHWHCEATRGDRSCRVACFHLRRPGGPQYLTEFSHASTKVAIGRTRSVADTLSATRAWLEGCELGELNERHEFVDGSKRSLARLADAVLARCPDLGQSARHEVRHSISDIYELWFTAGDRASQIAYYGEETTPRGYFYWDEFMLFRLDTADPGLLARALQRWLHEQVMPSSIAAEFPSVEMRESAAYHEQGLPVEGEFVSSWNSIERFYRDFPRWPLAESHILPFIRQLRAAGYDRLLRAGQSMTILMLSRSKRHGLRQGQPYIAFEFSEKGMKARARLDRAENVHSDMIAVTPEVRSLLDRLASTKGN